MKICTNQPESMHKYLEYILKNIEKNQADFILWISARFSTNSILKSFQVNLRLSVNLKLLKMSSILLIKPVSG